MRIMILKLFLVVFLLILLYLYAIMPRIRQKPDKRPFEGYLYAHRGLFDNTGPAPENSLPAFAQAAACGYGIELDIQLSKDGIPVVFHDFTLQRACGREGKVADYTYEQLRWFSLFDSGEKIPTLEKALSVIAGRVPIIIELKIEWSDLSLCPAAEEVLKGYAGPYAVESFNPLGLIWYRLHRRGIMRGQLADHFRKEKCAKGPFYFLLHYMVFNFLTKPDFIAYHHKYYKNMSRQLCRYLFGATAVAWTIRSEEELRRRRGDFDWFIFDSFIPAEGIRKS